MTRSNQSFCGACQKDSGMKPCSCGLRTASIVSRRPNSKDFEGLTYICIKLDLQPPIQGRLIGSAADSMTGFKTYSDRGSGLISSHYLTLAIRCPAPRNAHSKAATLYDLHSECMECFLSLIGHVLPVSDHVALEAEGISNLPYHLISSSLVSVHYVGSAYGMRTNTAISRLLA